MAGQYANVMQPTTALFNTPLTTTGKEILVTEKRGRKKLPSNLVRSIASLIRLRPEEWNDVVEAATRAGRRPAEWIRIVAVRFARKKLGKKDQDI